MAIIKTLGDMHFLVFEDYKKVHNSIPLNSIHSVIYMLDEGEYSVLINIDEGTIDGPSKLLQESNEGRKAVEDMADLFMKDKEGVYINKVGGQNFLCINTSFGNVPEYSAFNLNYLSMAFDKGDRDSNVKLYWWKGKDDRCSIFTIGDAPDPNYVHLSNEDMRSLKALIF